VKKLAATVLLPILAVCLGVFVFVWWERGAPPGMRPAVVDVTPSALTMDHRGVRMLVTAHHDARLEQEVSGAVWHMYPVFDKGDRDGRTVKVILRTPTAPNPLYSYEERVVTGFARPPGRLVPPAARELMEQRGYTLDQRLVLVEEWTD
jgi:hypothetical protein